jgi:putative glycerol-1-phosphate prenyltransferase
MNLLFCIWSDVDMIKWLTLVTMSIADIIAPSKMSLAVLIDPEKQDLQSLGVLIEVIANGHADLILVGGSTAAQLDMDSLLKRLRHTCPQPIVLFPGHANQLSAEADMIMLPSIISGDSFKYVIGEHINHAQEIKTLALSVSSAGYILIDGGQASSTSLMTSSKPMAPKNVSAIENTALAAEMIGMSCVYLEAGSGADKSVDTALISRVKTSISIPLIVGGGIDGVDKLEAVAAGSPDMIVIGNALERDPRLLIELSQRLSQLNEQKTTVTQQHSS